MNNFGAGDPQSEDDRKARHDVLLKVYDVSVNEYRFNVQLVWDRTKFFLVLSSAMIAAGLGLFKVVEGSPIPGFFLALFFLFSAFITECGRQGLELGKRYYRESIYTKTLVERELGLLKLLPNLPGIRPNLSIAVTDGQRDYRSILFGEGPQRASQISPGTVVANIQTIFCFIIVIQFLGYSVSFYTSMQSAVDMWHAQIARIDIAYRLLGLL